MRIVGGSFRGMKLHTTPPSGRAPDIRPTTSRIRTVIFDCLLNGPHGDRVTGRTVLDLFAGTGAMGLEALSRGAKRALFVEHSRAAADIVRRNIAVTRTEERTRVVRCDARSLPRRLAEYHDLVFVDPPYASNVAEGALRHAWSTGWMGPGSWIVIEGRTEVHEMDGVDIITLRKFGSTVVSIGQVRENP